MVAAPGRSLTSPIASCHHYAGLWRYTLIFRQRQRRWHRQKCMNVRESWRTYCVIIHPSSIPGAQVRGAIGIWRQVARYSWCPPVYVRELRCLSKRSPAAAAGDKLQRHTQLQTSAITAGTGRALNWPSPTRCQHAPVCCETSMSTRVENMRCRTLW